MAGSSELQAVSPEVIKAAGPLLFAAIFNWALYGILCVQIYVYSYNFPQDGRIVKSLAYLLFLMETVQTALTGVDVYYWFVSGFGNVERLRNSHFTPVDIPIMTAVSSLLVQAFFCYRIRVLDKRLVWLCGIIAVASVTQAVAAMWLGISSLKAVGKYVVNKAAIYLWSIPSAVADVAIVIGMTLVLRQAGSKFSSFVLVRLVRLSIETNALTAALAITALVLYAVFPDQVYYIYASGVIGKLYSNTLLVSLNNRIYIRDHKSSARDHSTFPPPSEMAFTIAVTPQSLAMPGTESNTRASNADVESFPLYTISQSVDLNSSKGDDTSIDPLSYPKNVQLPPQQP